MNRSMTALGDPFGKRIPDMPLYVLFLIPLMAVFALRMPAWQAPRTVEVV